MDGATMRIFGLAGWSGSGKTTLMTALIPEFVSRGVTVSTVKHAHHAFDIDRPGKDSWRHRQAGAREVMVASTRRWALMHELRDSPEPSLDELAARMAQLSDDCFAFGGTLLGVDAALALIEERVTPVVEMETLPLAEAFGRILAR